MKSPWPWIALTTAGWATGNVTSTGLVGTIVPFCSLLQVVERAEIAEAALIGYLVPVASAVAAVIFLGDPVTASLVIGGTIIMAGVVLADRGEVLSRAVGVRKVASAHATAR